MRTIDVHRYSLQRLALAKSIESRPGLLGSVSHAMIVNWRRKLARAGRGCSLAPGVSGRAGVSIGALDSSGGGPQAQSSALREPDFAPPPSLVKCWPNHSGSLILRRHWPRSSYWPTPKKVVLRVAGPLELDDLV